jgi:flagellar basal body-associated protein FliL
MKSGRKRRSAIVVLGRRGKQPRMLTFVYRALQICLLALGLIVIAGTVYGVFFRAAPSAGERPAFSGESGEDRQEQIFTGIGRLRVPTRAVTTASAADAQSETAILFVIFPYSPEDRAFSEELALRIRDFREIITDYIGSFSAAELHEQGEETIKAELLRRFNAILRLGRIETLYFSDFMVIEYNVIEFYNKGGIYGTICS